MLNTLANHGLLPHNGKDISEEVIIEVLNSTLNVADSLSVFLFEEAMTTVEDPNATTFSLSDLNRHNILEHDASLRYFATPGKYQKFKLTRSVARTPISEITMSSTRQYSTRQSRTGQRL